MRIALGFPGIPNDWFSRDLRSFIVLGEGGGGGGGRCGNHDRRATSGWDLHRSFSDFRLLTFQLTSITDCANQSIAARESCAAVMPFGKTHRWFLTLAEETKAGTLEILAA